MIKFNVITIDFKSDLAQFDLVESLRNTGFAVVRNHDIDKKLISGVYSEWSDFFNGDFKHSYRFDVK